MNAQATLPTSAPPAHDALWALIHDIRVAMITTRHLHGAMRARPITPQNRFLDDAGRLWFVVPLDSELAEELMAEPQVNLVYAAPDRGRYVSVTGDAGFVFDDERKARLLPTLAKAWRQEGVAGSNLGLLEVRIEQAESWDAATGSMQPVFRAGDAVDSGFGPDALSGLTDGLLPIGNRAVPAGEAAYLQ